jgi:recombination protein RecA
MRRLIKRQPIRERGGNASPAEEQGGGLYFAGPKENIQFIRTGCTLLDCVLGGGWALGRTSNVVGDKSTGKTLLAMEAIANIFQQYPDARVRYNEAESAFDADYARALGIPFDRVEFKEDCKTVEELYDDVDNWIKNELKKRQPALYILDSVDALSDAGEMERDFGEATYGGGKAKQFSQFFRRKIQELKETNCHLMFISQTRDNIGAMFGEKHTRSGGKALDFYASQILWLAHLGILKRTVQKVERPVGVKIKARCKKNKVGLPFRDCEFEITFGYGIEDAKASHAWLKELADVTKHDGDALREYVLKKWSGIETSFLPTRRKYGET